MSGTLPASGPISSSQIASVWETAATNISLDGLANSASITVGDTTISMSQFYGTGPQSDYSEYYYYDVGQKNVSFACSFQTNDQLFYSNTADNSHLNYPAQGARLFDGSDPATASPLNLVGGQTYGVDADASTDVSAAITISFNPGEANLVSAFSLCP